MTDHPIIFSKPMIRALIEGRKTQTRRLAHRIIKLKNPALDVPNEPGLKFGQRRRMSPWQHVEVGDRLWVRETFFDTEPVKTAPLFIGREQRAAYLADDDFIGCHKWTPSIHMPRWASRLTLTVTATKIERLQDISEADAAREGAARLVMDAEGKFYESERGTHRCGFAGLWAFLHSAASWDSNPEVVAFSFTVQQCNIDQLPT